MNELELHGSAWIKLKILTWAGGSAWVAQSVKHPTPDFGPGYDLAAHEMKPHVGLCINSAKPAWECLSPSLSLSAPPLLTLFLSLKISK